ncbi:hypothetical protein [Sphingomonas sp. LB2R24]|uniref:hypothetical protein n=1 Tax=Sphingomonas sorbitolis TaxID=3096165 RepID=UPI002FC9102F
MFDIDPRRVGLGIEGFDALIDDLGGDLATVADGLAFDENPEKLALGAHRVAVLGSKSGWRHPPR